MLFTDVTRWSCKLSVGQDRDYKMAGVTGLWRVLERHKSKIIETDVNRILYALCQKGLISVEEELLLRNERDHEKRVDLFVNILSKKGFAVFREFCATLEVVSPCLLTSFLLDIFDSLNEDKATAQSLKQELILRDRNLLNLATGKFNNRLREKDRSSLSSKLTGDPLLSEEWDNQTNKRWRHSMPLPHTYPKSSLDILDGQRVTWEYHTVTLTRVAGYGFGIAVSGGRDNPHFANGDPAIAISDVLKAGPAEGKLQINDRVVSANGISLENVNYNTAVQVLRDCGPTVNLVIKRRVVLHPSSNEPQSIKVTLTKSKKKDDFGIVLGCRIYVKEITNRSLVEKEGSVQEGDVIMKINTASTDTMTLKEARKLIENSKERLQLIVRREAGRHNNNNNNNQHQQWSNGILFEPPHTQNKDLSSPANFVDVTGTRPQWTNQNLYVQPPTRGDYRSPLSSDCNDDKNNLSRMQGGRNRGPLMDISLSQLDQPATPLLTGHGHSRAPINLEDEEPPPRPPLPRIDEYCGRRDTFDEDPLRRNKPTADPRFISFQKDGNVGIRLTGGNEVGIFVTAVQPGSPALLQGLQPGDKILKVNDVDMRGMTREEAVLLLLTIQDQVNLIVQHFKEEYDEVVANQRGDSFYIRTHFSYEGSVKNELNFRVGEIFHVIDTLHNGVVGSWLVYRLGRNNQEIQKGIIPNRNRAEEWAHEQQIQAKKDTASESRGSFFKRRSARRSKSLSKDHWEDIVFADGLSKFPAYERVTLKHPGFTRPVVLFGPLADVARDKLLKDYPDQYASPQLDSQLDDIPKSQKSSGIIRLSAIKEIIQKGKHAVLDITPNAVDRLNYAQFYPIVIFMHAENKHTVKELRSRLAKSSHKSSKKLYDHAVKLEKLWSHIFTAVITLTGADMWYKKLRDTIDKQQQQAIWVSESKPQEAISDDFLFPMTSRLSYASSPESDLDLTNDTRPMSLQARSTSPPGAERHMVKASSDPSIATQEDMGGLPGYSQLPPYSALSRTRQEPPSSINHLGQELINHDMLTPQKHLDETNRDPYYGSTLQSSIDPYPTLSRERSHRNNDGSDHQSKGRSNQPEPPPRIDRSSKPTHFRGSQDRTFGNQIRTEHSQDSTIGISADYINTANNKSHSLERPNGRLGTFDSSSFSSDSYNKYSTAPNALDNKSRDHYNSTSHNPRSIHDPYRFTRSTAQPSKPTNSDLRNRMSQVSSKYRMSDGRPVPPPKPSHYQLRPWQSEDDGIEAGFNHVSHTPAGFRSSEALPPPPYSRSSRDCSEFPMHPPYYTPKAHTQVDTMNSLRPPPPPMPDDQRGLHDTFNSRTMGSPSRRAYHDNDSGGFDSGRGSSLDRNYDFRAYTKSINNNTGMSPPRSTTHMNGGGPYHNVPYPPRREPPNPPPYDHHPSPPPPPPSSLLDLSNRENRGSAFELYKKPDSRSPLGIPPSLLAGNPERPNSPSLLSDNNHNVIATARGVFDHTGGTLFSEETGVCIIIPPGALPEGKKQEIFFKVCQEDKIMPPLDQDKGETLLSPLVMCGPHGLQFNIPVELKLPHCASVNPENWSFSLKASDTPNGQPIEWRNVALDKISGEIESCIDDNFVSILVDHF